MRSVTPTVGPSFHTPPASRAASAGLGPTTRSTPSIAPPLLAALFHGLGDQARLSCLFALRARSRTVGEVVAATGLSQPNVSKHLACLRDCGLVQAEKSGRFVTYCLCGTGVEELLQAAEVLIARVGDDIAACPAYQSYQTDGIATASEIARTAASDGENG